jgi:hypothetical protein
MPPAEVLPRRTFVDVAVQTHGRFFQCPGPRGFQFTLSQFRELLAVLSVPSRPDSGATRNGLAKQPSPAAFRVCFRSAASGPRISQMLGPMKLSKRSCHPLLALVPATEAMYGSHMSLAGPRKPLICSAMASSDQIIHQLQIAVPFPKSLPSYGFLAGCLGPLEPPAIQTVP